MSLSEVVRGIGGVYYTYRNSGMDYMLFMDRGRQIAGESFLELNVNNIYRELSGIGTKPLVDGYIRAEETRIRSHLIAKEEHRQVKVPIQEAFEYTQKVLQYAEFFIKYEMLMPQLEQTQRKRFESILAGTGSADEAITAYNKEIDQTLTNGLRAYMVCPLQSLASIRARSNKGHPGREHRNKYGAVPIRRDPTIEVQVRVG